MSKWLEKQEDGSLAFFIDGDLQFDSRDERIYHECLALPVLALAQRSGQKLNALIVGGGDGLCARELLKSTQIQAVDLVDYDAEVIELARTTLANLNHNALADARLHVHIEDAWEFVKRASEQRLVYDLIIVDLTVAQTPEEARFHSVEWYEMLRALGGTSGVIVTNACSPCATPEAFFSIFNGIRAAGLYALPYRVAIGSFMALGYGPDWSFVLCAADKTALIRNWTDLQLLEGRTVLRDSAHLRKLFLFPQELRAYQLAGQPAFSNSDLLLHYFFNATEISPTSGDLWDMAAEDLSELPIPKADRGGELLPSRIRDLLADQGVEEDVVLSEVLELMPALHRFHTRSIIRDFLGDPGAFLSNIDMVGLLEELLRRAAELPRRIVDELVVLKERLTDWAGDYLSLLSGARIASIVAVVVILGNLVYPDAVYGKGEHGGDHGGHGDGGRGDRGFGGRGDRGFGGRGFDHGFADRGWGNHFNHWGHWNSWGGHWGHWGGWARPWHRWWGGGWGGWVGAAPWAGWGLPISTGININTNTNSVDEEGNQYPVRNYNYGPSYVTEYGASDGQGATVPPATQPGSSLPGQSGQPTSTQGVYRLGPDTDVLPDGKLTMQLTTDYYLMLQPDRTQVLDQSTGNTVMSLYSDPSLRWHLANEIQRQQNHLEAAIQSKQGGLDSSSTLGFQQQGNETRAELGQMKRLDNLLTQALQQLGSVGDRPVPADRPPLDGAFEVFSSVWMTNDGRYLIMKRPDGSIAYLDGNGWYSDAGQTKLSGPYPRKFCQVVASYLSGLIKDSDSATASLTQDKQEAQSRIQSLQQDLQNLVPDQSNGTGGPVAYGAEQTSPDEARRRTRLAIRQAQHRLDFVNKQLSAIPQETEVAKKVLAQLNQK